jgi:hypothetical protein
MSKSQNRDMENKRIHGDMIPQKVNNHTIEDLVGSEGEESSHAEVRKTRIKMFKELKEDYRNNSMNPKRMQIKKN